MVDTVKLLIPIPEPLHLNGSKFVPTIRELVNQSYGKAVFNPSPNYAKAGIYMPRLTLFKRPSKTGSVYQLAVEFSAPKMLFNNNFDELTEDDFNPLIQVLRQKLFELVGFHFFSRQLEAADVGAWHPSKNIIFLDYTACQTVLNTIAMLDISRTYDLQKTDFRDGHVVHIHCNSLDIAFYDKMADMRKAKKSGKRAVEKNGLIQLNLFEALEQIRPFEVFRYEVRLNGRAIIKRAYPELDAWTFESLFKRQLCQETLIKHWQKLTASVDILALDVKQPYELLQNYIEENPDAKPQNALAAVAGMMIASQVGASGLRNVLEARYGKQAWYRIKPLLKSPQPYRFTHFQRIDEALEQFRPTHLSEYQVDIDKTSK